MTAYLDSSALAKLVLVDKGLRDAGVVADMYGLRAGDAIQFASLRRFSPGLVPMIAWDTRLRAAALASGYPIYPPAI